MQHMSIPITISAIGILCMFSSVSKADLTGFQWQNRLLLIFAPTESDPDYIAIEKNLTDSILELKDRDVVVIRVFKESHSRIGEQVMPSKDALKLYHRFKAQTDRITAVLIGKDGGVKLVREYQVNLAEIFTLIDSMPMRQQEIRQKGRTQ